jgi:hypothetical protein
MVCLIQTRETSIEDVSIHVDPPRLASEDVDRFYRVITEDRQSTILETWQIRRLVEINPADPKGGQNVWGIS